MQVFMMGLLILGAKLLRYKHLDMENLENLLIKYRDKYEDILVVTETVYSMDGDVADIKKLVELKRKYNFDLMVDEAHSYGVNGYGIAYENNLVQRLISLLSP